MRDDRRHAPRVPVAEHLASTDQVRAGRARRAARALLHDPAHRQGRLGARLRGDPRRPAPSASVLVHRPRPGLQPAGRGRARAHGRPLPGGRLRRGGGPHDGRDEHPARWPGRGDEPARAGRSARTPPTSSGAPAARRRRDARPAATARGRSRSPTASAASPASCGSRRARRSRTSSAIRHAEAEARGRARSAPSFRCLDLGDYPLADRRRRARARSPTRSARSRPTCSSPTPTRDPFNPDHPVASPRSTARAALAAGAGVASAFATVTPPALFLFEPHQPELCNFTPTTFVDITAVIERKQRGDGRR